MAKGHKNHYQPTLLRSMKNMFLHISAVSTGLPINRPIWWLDPQDEGKHSYYYYIFFLLQKYFLMEQLLGFYSFCS